MNIKSKVMLAGSAAAAAIVAALILASVHLHRPVPRSSAFYCDLSKVTPYREPPQFGVLGPGLDPLTRPLSEGETRMALVGKRIVEPRQWADFGDEEFRLDGRYFRIGGRGGGSGRYQIKNNRVTITHWTETNPCLPPTHRYYFNMDGRIVRTAYSDVLTAHNWLDVVVRPPEKRRSDAADAGSRSNRS